MATLSEDASGAVYGRSPTTRCGDLAQHVERQVANLRQVVAVAWCQWRCREALAHDGAGPCVSAANDAIVFAPEPSHTLSNHSDAVDLSTCCP